MELIRGTLDLLILRTLSWGPMHGYAISRWIRERSGDVLELTQGALYPALRRLEAGGHLASAWEVSDTGRDTKVYSLTPGGRAHLRRLQSEWSRYVDLMERVPLAPEGVR
ncbi:MAG: PadR family transcriptional regulator [Gemmatimonadota bacterium]